MRRFKSLIPAACIAALNLASPQALAQAYPSKPVRIVVPYASGGGSDILARQIGASLQKAWGQGVVGVTTAHRYGLLPDTPTFEEQGLKPFDSSIWYALMRPAKLPAKELAGLIKPDSARYLQLAKSAKSANIKAE